MLFQRHPELKNLKPYEVSVTTRQLKYAIDLGVKITNTNLTEGELSKAIDKALIKGAIGSRDMLYGEAPALLEYLYERKKQRDDEKKSCLQLNHN